MNLDTQLSKFIAKNVYILGWREYYKCAALIQIHKFACRALEGSQIDEIIS